MLSGMCSAIAASDLYGEDEDRTVIQNALQSCVLMLTSCCKLPFCGKFDHILFSALNMLWIIVSAQIGHILLHLEDCTHYGQFHFMPNAQT